MTKHPKRQITADPQATRKVEDQVVKMCQAIPESLKTIFNRAAALSLVYNSEAALKIWARNQLNNQKEADS